MCPRGVFCERLHRDLQGRSISKAWRAILISEPSHDFYAMFQSISPNYLWCWRQAIRSNKGPLLRGDALWKMAQLQVVTRISELKNQLRLPIEIGDGWKRAPSWQPPCSKYHVVSCSFTESLPLQFKLSIPMEPAEQESKPNHHLGQAAKWPWSRNKASG